jgi:flagella synthesis protein FlgN
MSRGRALAELVRGVEQDGQAYGALRDLLEQQFRAALRHDSAALATLADRILALVGEIDGRRQQRESLCAVAAGARARMDDIVPLLPEAARGAFAAAWKGLESQVRECKELNSRNGRLMTEQHAVMQRVLHGEMDTYAPA